MPRVTEHHGKRGTTWRVRFRHRGRQTTETFTTRREAEAWLSVLEAHGPETAVRLREEGAVDDDPTIAEITAQWLDWKALEVRSDRTIADYAATIERHVLPTFGSTPANHVRPQDVQQWIDTMRKDGASPKSLRDRHALLHATYKWARQRALTAADPCEHTKLPKRQAQAPKALTRTEWARLLPALRDIDPGAADLAQFLVATGLRWSEATALTGSDIDDGPVLHVNVNHVQRRMADGTIQRTADTKSAAGVRRIAVDPATATIVRAHITGPDNLVWTTSRGNMWRYPNYRERFWMPAVEAAGLAARNPTVHWLRHTHATWLLQSGVATLQDIQRRLGHASITTTVDTYGRQLADVRPEALDAFSAMLTPDSPPPSLPGRQDTP